MPAVNEEGVKLALNEMVAHIDEQDGRWVVSSTLDVMGENKYGMHRLPICEGEAVVVAGVYQSAENGMELCLRHVEKENYDAYEQTLVGEGWVKYTESTMACNRFAAYTNDNENKTLHLGYYPTLNGGTLRLVSVPTGYLPATEAAGYTRVADTTFTQIKREAVEINSAPGMSYIMQLADASFIVIDGGPANTQDEDALLEYLKALTPDGQKPVIAAWFITHAHSDHMGLANQFLTRYHDEIEVRMAAYNFPTYDTVQNAADVKKNRAAYEPMIEKFIGNITMYWPQAEHWILHAGQRLYLADAEIEVFFTHEDLFPYEYAWINHTSTAFRIIAGGKTVMILGDCEKTLCRQMADTYGDYLKSDMLQLTHHGANGACLDLYQRIDPDICFWACAQKKYESDERMLGTKEGYEFNAYLRDVTVRSREHYHSSETAVMTITKK